MLEISCYFDTDELPDIYWEVYSRYNEILFNMNFKKESQDTNLFKCKIATQ